MSITKYSESKKQLLDQINLYGIPLETPNKLGLKSLYGIIKDYVNDQLEVSKSLIKTGQEILPANISTTPSQEVFERLHEQVKLSSIYKEFEADLITKAGKYNIPCDGSNMFHLEDEIYEWESLLKQAVNYGIKWLENNYDPNGLRQEIEDSEYKAYKEQKSLHSYYCATRL